MKQFTYQQYRTNALLREQFEREVRRARSAAMGRVLALPLRALVRRLQRKPTLVLVVRPA